MVIFNQACFKLEQFKDYLIKNWTRLKNLKPMIYLNPIEQKQYLTGKFPKLKYQHLDPENQKEFFHLNIHQLFVKLFQDFDGKIPKNKYYLLSCPYITNNSKSYRPTRSKYNSRKNQTNSDHVNRCNVLKTHYHCSLCNYTQLPIKLKIGFYQKSNNIFFLKIQ